MKKIFNSVCDLKSGLIRGKISSKLARKIREEDGQLSEIACGNLTHVSSVLCTSLCKYKREERDRVYWPRERHVGDIYLAAILRRDYPRRIVRAIDGSSIDVYGRNQRVGASRRAMQQCSTRAANARAHVPRTYNTTRIVGRARDGRVSDVIKAIMVIIIGGLRP